MKITYMLLLMLRYYFTLIRFEKVHDEIKTSGICAVCVCISLLREWYSGDGASLCLSFVASKAVNGADGSEGD